MVSIMSSVMVQTFRTIAQQLPLSVTYGIPSLTISTFLIADMILLRTNILLCEKEPVRNSL
jgi:hypothetical protein